LTPEFLVASARLIEERVASAFCERQGRLIQLSDAAPPFRRHRP